jgi:hypothetical protein
MQAAGQVADEFGTEIVVIQKTSEAYGKEENPPPCPSVAVDGTFVVLNGTVTAEDLRQAVGITE